MTVSAAGEAAVNTRPAGPAFTSLGSFSTRFTELVGLSPSAYRREAARRGGPAPIPGCFALMWRTGLPAPPGAPASRATRRPDSMTPP